MGEIELDLFDVPDEREVGDADAVEPDPDASPVDAAGCESIIPPDYRGNPVWVNGADPDQPELFSPSEVTQAWQVEYRGMPEYRHEIQTPWGSVVVRFKGWEPEPDDGDPDEPTDGGIGRDPYSVKVNFEGPEDKEEFRAIVDASLRQMERGEIRTEMTREEFADTVAQTVTERTQSIWYPEAEISRYVDKQYFVPSENATERNRVRYPVYVPSKGRAENCTTPDVLESLGVPHHIVVEPDEVNVYEKRFGRDRLIVLPDDLAPGLHTTRTWIKRYCIRETGAARHWQIDDNIRGFYRYNRNLKTPVADGTVLRCIEDFVDRYENVALAGPHYFMFVSRKSPSPPITLNTRVYSCTLVNNAIPHEWTLRYNDDTDISLRVLKDDWAIVLFSAFLQDKAHTMTFKGGLTEDYESMDGRKEFAEMLRERHPEVVSVTRKFGRWHHHVDYGPFRGNRLKRRPGFDPTDLPVIDDRGMLLRNVETGRLIDLT